MVTIVYGAPCSGKSTYVERHMGPNDILCDADAIFSALSGREAHDLNLAQYSVATDMRETLYDIIRDRKGRWENAWVMSCAATDGALRRDMERVNADRAVLIDTPKEICLERAKERPDVFRAHVERWFERDEQSREADAL